MSATISKQLTKTPTPEQRAASIKAVRKLSVGNRFRLMYGAPLLPDEDRKLTNYNMETQDAENTTKEEKPPTSPRSDRRYRCTRCEELWEPIQISSTWDKETRRYFCDGCESVL